MSPTIDPQERAERFNYTKDLLFKADRQATDLALLALKTAMILNGASAIALLAFIGQLWESTEVISPILNEMVLGLETCDRG